MKLRTIAALLFAASCCSFTLPAYAIQNSPLARQLLKSQSLSEKIVIDEKQLQQDTNILMKLNAEMYGMIVTMCSVNLEICRLSTPEKQLQQDTDVLMGSGSGSDKLIFLDKLRHYKIYV